MSYSKERTGYFEGLRQGAISIAAYDGPICNECIHRKAGEIKCNAYPDGIPRNILTGKIDHRKKYINDNGIRFEPIPRREDG